MHTILQNCMINIQMPSVSNWKDDMYPHIINYSNERTRYAARRSNTLASRVIDASTPRQGMAQHVTITIYPLCSDVCGASQHLL